ncbi:MAG: hypothetical protein JWP08_2434 [Bryobacterales bacterium]|nr:hypothetical protein [Bryobacterales bacterium]
MEHHRQTECVGTAPACICIEDAVEVKGPRDDNRGPVDQPGKKQHSKSDQMGHRRNHDGNLILIELHASHYVRNLNQALMRVRNAFRPRCGSGSI